ncbi:hypothetical protein C8Q73DRAFT_803900 [Cubamyces lactineus]|nr:hypothetical protein C8Q73DRAFT_803900 [Cubamyces lactineus]
MPAMQAQHRFLASASPRELNAKLELLQQLGYEDRFLDNEEDHIQPLSEKSYLDDWIQTEYSWALEETADSASCIPDLFDVEGEDEEVCLPWIYDPMLFNRTSAPLLPARVRSQSLTQPPRNDCEKPLPGVPPLKLRLRPTLSIVPPPTPSTLNFSSPIPFAPVSLRSPLSDRKQTPPPSPRLSPRLSASPKLHQPSRPHAASVSTSTRGWSSSATVTRTTRGASTLLPSPMSDATVMRDPEGEEVSPGEAITWSPSDDPASQFGAPAGAGDDAEGMAIALTSRCSLDSVASHSRIRQADVPEPPPNTPCGSLDVLDICCSRSHEAMQSLSSRPSSNLPAHYAPKTLVPSVLSSSGSSASTLATPVEPMLPSPLPEMNVYHATSSSYMYEEEPVFAENPHFAPESPLLMPEHLKTPLLPQRELLVVQIPDRPMTPDSPPPQLKLLLPSPSTPSPLFLVPTPRLRSFFASLTGRQRWRRKKLIISGAMLNLNALQAPQSAAEAELRAVERARRVQNMVRWCESFGPVRKIDTKDDGSLHVYWKDWEAADMVCRIQAQVVIKDVGRVNLAWSYTS